MTEFLTFSQCLSNLMQANHVSTAAMTAIAGGRAELKKILSETATAGKRNQVFDAIVSSGLFSGEDCDKLAVSLEVSRIGLDSYKFQQAIESILNHQISSDTVLCTERGTPLRDLLLHLKNADKIELLCINSCFHSLISAVLPLFESRDQKITMWHLIHANAFANTASSFVAVSFPLLFDDRYLPYRLELPPEADVHAIGGNLLALQAHFGANAEQLLFSITDDKTAVEMPNASEAKVFSFLGKILLNLSPQPIPIKESPMAQENYTLLCMNYLSHELNRATYSVANDIYFHQTPADIAVAALRDKGSFSKEDIQNLIDRTLSIHEQRYQNQYAKKKSTYRIMTVIGCERFLKSGLCTDHFFGFRAFTPEERKRIFGEMIFFSKVNPNFIPLILKDHSFEYRYNLICYDKLGVSLDMTNTDYDIEKGHHSVFLMFPEFTQQYMEYYLTTLVKEKCHSRQESLQILENMYKRFCEENP